MKQSATFLTPVFYLFVGFSLFFLGCNNSPETDTDIVIDETSEGNLEHAKDMMYLVPSPIETVMLLHRAGAQYDSKLLNKVENASNYETQLERTVNLGIYAADLSYASIFDMTQESMFYVSVCKKLAEGLGIMNAFDKNTIERMENNINDRDSMLRIISDVYLIADAYLKENENESASALIIAGGWLEGLHIAVGVAKNSTDNEDLLDRIAEQKYALENLIALLSSYSQNEDLSTMLADLMLIKAEFDKLEVTEEEADSGDNEDLTVIGDSYTINISPEQFKSIDNQLNTVRNKYIQ